MYSRDSVISLSKLKTWTCACVQSLHSCLTLCDPVGCNPVGFSVHGIFPTRMLEWVAMPSSRGSSPPRDRTHISCMSCIAGGFFTAESLGKPPEDGLLNLSIATWLCQRASVRKLRPPPTPCHICFGHIFCQLPQFRFYFFSVNKDHGAQMTAVLSSAASLSPWVSLLGRLWMKNISKRS